MNILGYQEYCSDFQPLNSNDLIVTQIKINFSKQKLTQSTRQRLTNSEVPEAIKSLKVF